MPVKAAWFPCCCLQVVNFETSEIYESLIMRNDNRNINVVKPCIGHLIGLPYNELSSKKSLTVAFLTVVILPIRNDNSSQLKDVCLKLIREVATFSHVKLLPES